MTFEENKTYLRQVLSAQMELSSFDSEFVPVTQLPPGHRYFAYQAQVNKGGTPTEEVIRQHKERFGSEYRLATEGEHPVEALREDDQGAQLAYTRAVRTNTNLSSLAAE